MEPPVSRVLIIILVDVGVRDFGPSAAFAAVTGGGGITGGPDCGGGSGFGFGSGSGSTGSGSTGVSTTGSGSAGGSGSGSDGGSGSGAGPSSE